MDQRGIPKEVSIKELALSAKAWIRYLISKWMIIIGVSLLGGVVGICYAWLKVPVYVASSTFVLEESGGGGLGQYAGIASMMGVDLGGSSNNGIFQGDNIIELYKSRTMIAKTLLSNGEFDGKNESLLERYINFNNIKNKFPRISEFHKGSLKVGSKFTVQQDSILTWVVKRINEDNLFVGKPDKKLSIIKVELKSEDEKFAKQFNDQIVKNVNDFYVQTKTKKSLQNILILQHQTDSIRKALDNAISNVAISIDANPNVNPSRQILKVPSQKRQIDAEANKAILTELVKNLEISKVSLRKETPLIQIVDQPVYPLEMIKPGRFFGLIVGGVIGGLLSIFTLIITRLYKRLINE